MKDLPGLLEEGRKHGLLESSAANILSLLASHPEEYERASIGELAESGNWEELNNRFFRTLAFGTGGLRGKTIGAVVTAAERGQLQAMERPLLHHRSDVFKKELLKACEGMRWVFGWDSTPLFLACSGTGAMEAALLNSCVPGDAIISVNAGSFGARWRSIGERLGLVVHEIVVPWGSPVTVEQTLQALEQCPHAKALCLQHTETSTTVLHPVHDIVKAFKQRAPHILTMVDGISACLTTAMPGGPDTVDFYIAGSQKAFMLPPGLSMVALSNYAWSVVEKTPKRSLYFDFTLERSALSAGDTSWTPASTIIVGLNAALELVKAEGLEATYARHRLLSEMTRSALQKMGCTLVAPDAPAPSVTGFFPPTGIDADSLRSEVSTRFGVRLAGGQGSLSGKIVRVGHMGYVDAFDVLNAVTAIGLSAQVLGADVDTPAAISECLKALDNTTK
jgi:aspartate aminotransferase-like enzyme